MARVSKIALLDGLPASGKTTFLREFLVPALEGLGVKTLAVYGDSTWPQIHPKKLYDLFKVMPGQYPSFQEFLSDTLYKSQELEKRLSFMKSARRVVDEEIAYIKYRAEQGASGAVADYLLAQGVKGEASTDLLNDSTFRPDLIFAEMTTLLSSDSAKHEDNVFNVVLTIDEYTRERRAIARDAFYDEGGGQIPMQFRTYGPLIKKHSKKATLCIDNNEADATGRIRREVAATVANKLASRL